MPKTSAHPANSAQLRRIRIGADTYFETKEVLRAVGVSRQTLWNWRKDALIPAGSRHRNRIVFSEAEFAEIAAYAAKVQPVALNRSQLRLPLA